MTNHNHAKRLAEVRANLDAELDGRIARLDAMLASKPVEEARRRQPSMFWPWVVGAVEGILFGYVAARLIVWLQALD